METNHLDSANVLEHHLLCRLFPTGISAMAVREQQTAGSEINADQIPR